MIQRIRRALGIRGRLQVLVIIAILPLLFDRVHNVTADRAERVEAASRQARELAQSGADQQNERLATTRAFLQVVARSYATFAGSSEACGRFLTQLTTGIPWARGVSVADPDGRIVCSSNPRTIGLDISDRSHFQQAVRTGEFFVSEYMYGRSSLVPTMFASFAQRAADGSVDAVAVVAIDLSWTKQAVSVTAERSGSVVLMVDGTGTVIARNPDPETWTGRRFSEHPLVRQMLAGSEGTITENGIDGVRRIFSFVRLPGTEARFAVGLDENEILRRVNDAMWASYAQFAVIASIMLVGVWFGGERFFVRPIEVLARTAERIGQGELEVRTAEKPWAAEFVPLATALDDMAGQLARREHYLEELAQNDGLTGLANRRTFDGKLETEWELAARLNRPIALLMIDIDHFKLLNDHYGHVAGDACLRTLSKVFAEAGRRGSDLAARYGGEEFVLLLPGAELEAAAKVGERLRRAVDDLRIAHAKAPAGHVTVSVGVMSFRPQSGIVAQALIEAADTNLYRAKQRGRNTVVAHPPVRLAAVS